MFGDILSELRRDNEMTQRDLAAILNTSVATVSHYETETNAPDIATLIKIADYFGVSIDYLIGRTPLRMDFNMFSREVRLLDGTVISAEKILTQFLQLSDKSQAELVNLINLFVLRDSLQHDGLFSPLEASKLLKKRRRVPKPTEPVEIRNGMNRAPETFTIGKKGKKDEEVSE